MFYALRRRGRGYRHAPHASVPPLGPSFISRPRPRSPPGPPGSPHTPGGQTGGETGGHPPQYRPWGSRGDAREVLPPAPGLPAWPEAAAKDGAGGVAAEMSAKSCLGCTKCFLFFLNLFFFILGILLLAFGFWVLFDRQSFAAVLGSPLVSLRVWSYGFSGVGIVTMLLGFLGCLGALKEVKLMLGLYFGILLLLFAAQITVGIIIYTQRAALATKVAAYAEELIQGYPAQGPHGDPHESWDAVQQQLGCCGWKGPQDWDHHNDASGDTDRAIACSCLRAPNSTHETPWMLPHGRCPTAVSQNIFPEGCKQRVQTWLAGNLVTIVGVCIGIGLGELSLLMLSMFLLRNLDSHYEKLLRGI